MPIDRSNRFPLFPVPVRLATLVVTGASLLGCGDATSTDAPGAVSSSLTEEVHEIDRPSPPAVTLHWSTARNGSSVLWQP